MSRDRHSWIARVQPTALNARAMPRASAIRWPGWVILLGVLCMLGISGRAFSAGLAASASNSSYSPMFDFDEFTKNKPFTLNTLYTTPFGRPWADIVLKGENFLQCKGAAIALCYYSGPGDSDTPCELRDGEAIADCTCYKIPEGRPYYVDINAILNLDVYLKTVNECGKNGERCPPGGPKEAPVCKEINKGTLIPGADLISTFSLALVPELGLGSTPCDQPGTEGLYAGCMTAPCKVLLDSNGKPLQDASGNELVQCACPTWNGKFQVGQDIPPSSCTLGGRNVWSAAYTPVEELLPLLPPPPPPPPLGQDCWPDLPPDAGGCPLLPPNFHVKVPRDISCQTVCSEYKQSNQNGIQVGFTCDATLCTVESDPALVARACAGLGKHSVSEIIKLETRVGYSCAASQICDCQPNKKTNEEIWRLNDAQWREGILTQCEQNFTLCGTMP